jgi:hypothetical protein
LCINVQKRTSTSTCWTEDKQRAFIDNFIQLLQRASGERRDIGS